MTTRRGFLGRALAIPALALPALPVHNEEPIWVTQVGERIELSKVTDSHLLNIERMIRGDGYYQMSPSHPLAERWHLIILAEVVRRKLRTQPAYVEAEREDYLDDPGFE